MALNLVLLYGSVRSDPKGIRAARFVERGLTTRRRSVSCPAGEGDAVQV
jgi:hypothetical protein